jgi:hypothetical protein
MRLNESTTIAQESGSTPMVANNDWLNYLCTTVVFIPFPWLPPIVSTINLTGGLLKIPKGQVLHVVGQFFIIAASPNKSTRTAINQCTERTRRMPIKASIRILAMRDNSPDSASASPESMEGTIVDDIETESNQSPVRKVITRKGGMPLIALNRTIYNRRRVTGRDRNRRATICKSTATHIGAFSVQE